MTSLLELEITVWFLGFLLSVYSGSLKRFDYPKQICLAHSFLFEWFYDIGYPHDGRADKDSYPHDGHADKDSSPQDSRADKIHYPHDRHSQRLMLRL